MTRPYKRREPMELQPAAVGADPYRRALEQILEVHDSGIRYVDDRGAVRPLSAVMYEVAKEALG